MKLPGWRLLTLLTFLTLPLCAALLLALDRRFPLPLPPAGESATLVTAADGQPLRAFADARGIWRYPATVDSVSPLYLEALLAYEDRWFWWHPGVNPWALLRAGGQWLGRGRIISGGSTLTMQVARLLEQARGQPRPPRTLRTKIRQTLRALQLEWHLDKRAIVQIYLERAPFGGTIEGVEAASWAYLGKSAASLSHAEAALLAVLPQSPSRWRPDRHPEAARRARDKVLQRLQTQNVWPAEAVMEARMEAVVARTLHIPTDAALLAQRLRQQFPDTRHITTTLDSDLQRTLQARMRSYFSRLPERSSAALLVVDNASMHALAYIGTVAFADPQRLGHVDMVQAARSPGSTLKPFLYGMALDDGLIHSESLLVDAPQDFGGWRPGNFDAAFHGPVSASEALRRSLNVPAVDLLERVGPQRFAARLAHGGIRLQFPRGSSPNLTLILGGTGASLEDLVGAHAALARRGLAARVRYTPDAPLQERRLLSEGAAWMVREILASNPKPGERSSSRRARVAWKTGTSYGYRDAWALGSTTAYTVGVWVGRPDGTPLPGQYGALTALPLLFEMVDSLPQAPGGQPSARPASVQDVGICWPLGLAAGHTPPALCHQKREARVLDGNIPPTFAGREASRWHSRRVRFAVDAHSGQRVPPACPGHPQREMRELARWPAQLTPWLTERQRRAQQLPPLAPDCPGDGLESSGTLHIDGLRDQSTLVRAPGAGRPPRLRLRAFGSPGHIDWLLDGRRIAHTRGQQTFVQEFAQTGEHVLTALAADGAWAKVRFRVVVP